MPDDAKEWVTIKVPREDYEQATDYKQDGVTWGDCVVAGAERLNDHLDSDTGRFLDDKNYGFIRPSAEADTDLPDDVRDRLDRIEAATETIEQRTGRIEGTLEDLGGGR